MTQQFRLANTVPRLLLIILIVGFLVASTNLPSTQNPASMKVSSNLIDKEETTLLDTLELDPIMTYNHTLDSLHLDHNYTITKATTHSHLKVTLGDKQLFLFTLHTTTPTLLNASILSILDPNNEKYTFNDEIEANYTVQDLENGFQGLMIEGYFFANQRGYWNLEIDYQQEIANTSYQISVYIPQNGYSFQQAKKAEDNKLMLDGFYTLNMFHYRYWSVNLDTGQRTTIEINGSKLNNVRLEIFEQPNYKIYDETLVGNHLKFTFYPTVKQKHYIRLLLPSSEIIGDYHFYTLNISKSLNTGYNFETAIELQEQHSTTIELEFSDERYLSFYIQKPGRVRFHINESISRVLLDSQISFYTSNKEFITEENRNRYNLTYNYFTQQLLIDFHAEEKGLFYLTIEHNWFQPDGAITINYEIYTSSSLVIRSNDPIWGLLILVSMSLAMLGFTQYKRDDYYWFFSIGQFSSNISKQRLFKGFKDHLTILEQKQQTKLVSTQPNEKIILQFMNKSTAIILQFKTINESTKIYLSTVPSPLTYIISIGAIGIIYTLLNLILGLLFQITIFPIHLDYPALFLVFIVISILTLFIAIYHTVKQINISKTTNNWLKEIISNVERNLTRSKKKDKIAYRVRGKIHQTRRLWNQAMKSYKKKKYNNFIIKADSAIHHALEARYYQIKKNLDLPDNFLALCEVIRKNNFDIPSQNDCERFRTIRNGVVHGSKILNQEEANTILQISEKFLSRLGISS